MTRRASLAFVVCALLSMVAVPHGQARRFITEKDLFAFTWIADPQISPDGSTVAFVRVTVNEKENRYETSIFTVPAAGGDAPRRLTSGLRDTMPRWAPDGRRLAFVRSIEKDGKAQPGQVYLLPMDGGEARAITDGTSGANNPVWSPDGRQIAFTSATSVADVRKSDDPKPAAEHKSDVQVVTRAVYRENGNPGYVDTEHHAHIFTIPVPGSDLVANGSRSLTPPQPHQITDGEFDEGGQQWAPDGSTIYFTSTRVPEPYVNELGDELYAVPAGGGAIRRIAAIDGSIGNLSVSPDGKRIAFVGTLRGKPIRSYSQPDLFVVDTPYPEG
jgi:Tol biopolymer transport system component